MWGTLQSLVKRFKNTGSPSRWMVALWWFMCRAGAHSWRGEPAAVCRHLLQVLTSLASFLVTLTYLVKNSNCFYMNNTQIMGCDRRIYSFFTHYIDTWVHDRNWWSTRWYLHAAEDFIELGASWRFITPYGARMSLPVNVGKTSRAAAEASDGRTEYSTYSVYLLGWI